MVLTRGPTIEQGAVEVLKPPQEGHCSRLAMVIFTDISTMLKRSYYKIGGSLHMLPVTLKIITELFSAGGLTMRRLMPIKPSSG